MLSTSSFQSFNNSALIVCSPLVRPLDNSHNITTLSRVAKACHALQHRINRLQVRIRSTHERRAQIIDTVPDMSWAEM